MNTYRFVFERSSKKHRCPSCLKKRFVRYVDTETGAYLPDHYGRCDREVNCSYHLNPYKDGYHKQIELKKLAASGIKKSSMPRIQSEQGHRIKNSRGYIPMEVLKQTLRGYEHNAFIQNLLHRVPYPFGAKDIEMVVSLYYLGTICKGYRFGAITFPFIDLKGNVRAVQVKQFDQSNHTTGTDFLHSIIARHHAKVNKPVPDWLRAYQANEKKVSCLFGEHLLSKYPHNPVAIVEAPKTAIFANLYFGFPWERDGLLWLAAYNLSSLNIEKCKALKGRRVLLFPDLSKEGRAFSLWSERAKEFEAKLPGTRFFMSDLLEKHAPSEGRQKGFDLADYLERLDWRLFRSVD